MEGGVITLSMDVETLVDRDTANVSRSVINPPTLP